MKNTLYNIFISFCTLIIVIIGSCDNPNSSSGNNLPDDGEADLYGTWTYTKDYDYGETITCTLTLNDNGTFSEHFLTREDDIIVEDVTNGGTWTFSNDTLELDFVLEIYTYTVTISNDTLTLVDIYDNTSEVYTKEN